MMIACVNFIIVSSEFSEENEAKFQKLFPDVSYLIINQECKIKDNHTLEIDNKELFFDYLIIQTSKLLSNCLVETDSKKAITNYYLQTSVENFFAISPFNHSKKSVFEQLDKISECLNE